MKILKYTLLFLLLILITSSSGAIYDFLNVGVSARSNAMGGSFAAVSHDINALGWNPSGLHGVGKGMLSTSMVLYIADITFGEILYGFSKNKNSFGVGFNYVNYGSMERRDENNVDRGTFTPMDILFTAGYSRSFSENLSAGFNVKLVYEKIDSFVSYGAGGDFGIQYLMKERNLTLAVVLKNAGTALKAHDEEKRQFPLSFTGGLSFHPLPIVNLNFDVTRIFSDTRTLVRVGVEWWPVPLFVLRTGYSSGGNELKTDYGSDMLAGTSAGFGVSWKSFCIDYAVQPMVDLGFSHSISLTHTFQ